MRTLRIIAAATTSLLLMGSAMTQPTANDLDLDLPMAVQGVPESPVVMRIGVVSDIVESDNITVKISGSPTLVNASYLFPQYQPVLGDRVVVIRQDSQWFVMGAMSGPINTVVLNPSFELGPVGGLPTNWTFNVISSAGGTPTFTKVLSGDISGKWIGRIVNSSVGAGTSTADLISSSAPAVEGQRWTQAFYMTHAFINFNAASVPQGGNTTLETFIQFLAPDGVTLVSETSAGFLTIMTNVLEEIFNRTLTVGGDFFVVAPPGTAFVRLRIRASLVMNASSATAIGLDYMVLRTPD